MRRRIEEDQVRVSFYTDRQAKESYWDVLPVRVARANGKKKAQPLGEHMAFLEENDVLFDDVNKRRILHALAGANGLDESLQGRIPELLIIWRTGPDGRCTWLNEQWFLLTGSSWKQSEGLGWRNYVHPEDLPKVIERSKQAYAEKRPLATELRFRRRSGEWIWMRAHSVPRFGARGEVLGYDGTALPIPGPGMMLTPDNEEDGTIWATLSPTIPQGPLIEAERRRKRKRKRASPSPQAA